ncbi:radical SAM protein [Elusimicrobiota bacterium]
MKEYYIDSHKLIYHPKKVADWTEGSDISPIYLEVSPTNACNHKCRFCALDYVHGDPVFLDSNIFTRRIREMSDFGVKSVMYAGEGEPLMHPDIEDLIETADMCGIDTALTTNGTLLGKLNTENILKHLKWLRISINGGNRTSYADLHGCDEKEYDIVMDNLSMFTEEKRRHGSAATIGVQAILLPENADCVYDLCVNIKERGADYFIIKAYSQHLKNIKPQYSHINYEEYFLLENELKQLEDECFSIIFRKSSMLKVGTPKSYGKCNALDFFAYIDSHARVMPCLAVLSMENLSYGNMQKDSFADIWQSEKRKQVAGIMEKDFPGYCRRLCRMDEINSYLWKLKFPAEHVNFI